MKISAIQYNDEGGNIFDVEYFCDWHCMAHMLVELGVDYEHYVAGEATTRQGSVSYGGWPGGEETDYAVFCAHCEQKLWNGLEEEERDECLVCGRWPRGLCDHKGEENHGD